MMFNEICINLIHIGHGHYHSHDEITQCEVCEKIAHLNETKIFNIDVNITIISLFLFIIIFGSIFEYIFKYTTLITLKVKFSD